MLGFATLTEMADLLIKIGMIFIVVMTFNVIIFVHELGHFLAARWRKMQVDRFQVWFGKPIWSKTINGVQYGLGTIPFGGFVALPQMAPMESIEGKNIAAEKLAPVKPLDKIIVAAAGPLFSMLLALAVATVVWKVGKPDFVVPSKVIGEVVVGSPAEKAGLLAGDKILKIEGEEPDSFFGGMESIQSLVAMSEGETVDLVVDRNGAQKEISCYFEIADTPWFQRKALRKIGIAPGGEVYLNYIIENSPLDVAGLQLGDQLISINGEPIVNGSQVAEYSAKSTGVDRFEIIREGKEMTFEVQAKKPDLPEDATKMFGGAFGVQFIDKEVYTDPFTQVAEAGKLMWVSITKVVSRNNSIGVDQFNGPVGIGKSMFQMLEAPNGWKLLLWFVVVFNVNLAILNMMPFPVLDGGHIVFGFLEMLAGKPVQPKFLEFVQTGFVLLIFSFFIFVTLKDVGSFFPGKATSAEPAPQSPVFYPADKVTQ